MQWLGVLLGFSVVVVLAQETRGAVQGRQILPSGLIFVLICLLSGAVASISSKLAAEAVSKTGFMTLSYFFGVFFPLGINKKWGTKTSECLSKDAIILGLSMGILNFCIFYAFLWLFLPGLFQQSF